jgi:hypothetical protein
MAFLHRFVGVVEGLPPVRKALLSRQLKSRFIDWLVAAGSSGDGGGDRRAARN